MNVLGSPELMRAALQTCGKSCAQIARDAGVSQSTVYRYLRAPGGVLRDNVTRAILNNKQNNAGKANRG